MILRYYYPVPTIKNYPHPIYGWTYKPNSEAVTSKPPEIPKIKFTFNSRGFNDKDHLFKNVEGKTRILILGDSFAMGTVVAREKTFPAILEKLLNENCEKKVEVINASVAGWGTAQQLLYYNNEGHKYSPDITILALYKTNDILDNSYEIDRERWNWRPFFYISRENKLEIWQPPEKIINSHYRNGKVKSKLRALKDFLRENSRTYCLLYKTLPWLFPHITKKLRDGRIMTPLKKIPTEWAVFAKNEYSIEIKNAIEITKRIILELRLRVESNGGKFIVLEIPCALQVDKKIREDTLKSYGWNEGMFSWVKIDKIFEEFWRSYDIKFVRLNEIFMNHNSMNSDDHLYFPSEGHLNKRGHLKTAEVLTEFIINNRYVCSKR